MHLTLVRHMETPCSAAGRYCGLCDTDLSPRGHLMAAALGRHLCTEPFDALFCSDRRRAIHSAMPLSQLLGLPLQQDARLREIDYGSWDGLTPAQLRAQEPAAMAAWEAAPAEQAPPGGETAATVAERGEACVRQLGVQHPGARILVVAHKALIRLTLCKLLGLALNSFRARLDQPWGAISRLELLPQGPLLRSFGDVGYLGRLAAPQSP